MTSFSQALDGHLVFQYANRVPARLRVSHFTAETRYGGWGTPVSVVRERRH